MERRIRRMTAALTASAAAVIATGGATRAQSRAAATAVTLHDGVTLRIVQQGHGATRTVIFLHGYTDSSVSFRSVLERLDPSIRAIAIDQRGHGESSRPACCYGMDRFADDVVEVMDALGIPSSTIVGHSMGGVVSQLVAARYPDRVERLVLVATGATFRNPGVMELVAAIRQMEEPVDPAFARDFQASTVHKPLPDGHLDRYVGESLKLPARIWKAVAESIVETDLRPRLSQIRCPTLVIWGDRDGVVLRGDQETIVRSIEGAELKVYEDIGHAVHWEVPDRFVADLEAFLSQKL